MRPLPLLLASALLVAGSSIPAVPSAAGGACGAVEHGDVVYAYTWGGDAVERFDLVAGASLPAIPAPDLLPAAIATDGDTLFVADRHDQLQRLDLSGEVLARYSMHPSAVAVDGEVVIGAGSGSVRSFRKDSGEMLDEIQVADLYGAELTLLPGGRLLVASSTEAWILEYTAEGSLGGLRQVDPERNFPTPREPRVSPDGGRLVDANGTLWSASGLAYLGTVPTLGRTPVFAGTRFVSSGWQTLRLLDAELRELGQLALGHPDELFVRGETLWAAYCASDGVRFEAHALSEFVPVAPEPPLDLTQYDWEPGPMAVGSEGVVYFVPQLIVYPGPPRPLPQLWRWSIEEETYLPVRALAETPFGMTAAPGGGVHLFYGSSWSGWITKIAPGEGEEERGFATAPGAVDCLVEAGAWWLVCAGPHRYLYDADGHWRAGAAGLRGLQGVVWDPLRSRAIELRRPTYAPDRRFLDTIGISPGGALAQGAEVPAPSAEGRLELSPGGTRLRLGNELYDPETLAVAAQLGDVVDATWHGALLLSVEYDGSYGFTRYRERDPADGSVLRTVLVPGKPLRLLSLGGSVLYVRSERGQPVFARIVPGADDLDQDGVSDAGDAFPVDPAEWSDRDGDGVGDNGDAYPDDPSEVADDDGDGLGNQRDALPRVPALHVAELLGRQRVGLRGLPPLAAYFEGQIHLLEDGGFALCSARETCLFGVAILEAGRRPRYQLALTPLSLTALGEGLAAGLEDHASALAGRPLDLTLEFLPSSVKARLALKKHGTRPSFRLSARHRGRSPGYGRTDGSYVLQAKGAWLTAQPTPGAPADSSP